MIGYNKCKTCNNIIPKDSDICPFCGSELKELEKIEQNENENQQKLENQTEKQKDTTIPTDHKELENTTTKNISLNLEKQEIKSIIKTTGNNSDFFNISTELIKNNFSSFLLFSFLSNPLITFLLFFLNLFVFLFLTGNTLENLHNFNFSEYNKFLLILFIIYLFIILLVGLFINFSYLNDFSYRFCRKLMKIKESIKNNEIIDYKIYENLNLFESLKSGSIVLWYLFLYFILPIIIIVSLYLIFQVIFSILMSSVVLCCIAFPIYLIVNFLLSLIYTYLYLGFFIYLAYINNNNQKFNLIDSYKFIYNNFISQNLSNSFISITIYILFSQFILPIIYIFFILFSLGIGLIFLNLPLFILNSFIFSYLILNIDFNSKVN